MNYLVEYSKRRECYDVYAMCCFPKGKGLEKPREIVLSEDEMDFIIENYLAFKRHFKFHPQY